MGNEALVEAARVEPHWLQVKSPRDERVLRAPGKVDRAEFLPDRSRARVYEDEPLMLFNGATCSMPSLVALMADLLELQEGHRVLEIGTGCGYSAALTARLIGKRGRLTTIEKDEELYEFGMDNLMRYFAGLDKRVIPVLGDGSIGYQHRAPFDRIYLTAAGSFKTFRPEILLRQLKPSGILLQPEEPTGNLCVWRKGVRGELSFEQYVGIVSFVGLQGINA